MINGRHFTPLELRWMGALAQQASLNAFDAEAVFKAFMDTPSLHCDLADLIPEFPPVAEAAKPASASPAGG